MSSRLVAQHGRLEVSVVSTVLFKATLYPLLLVESYVEPFH
jgi:hypothetical protein